MIALVGVKNMAVVETEKALLVCDLQNVQRVKEVVEQLNASKELKVLPEIDGLLIKGQRIFLGSFLFDEPCFVWPFICIKYASGTPNLVINATASGILRWVGCLGSQRSALKISTFAPLIVTSFFGNSFTSVR